MQTDLMLGVVVLVAAVVYGLAIIAELAFPAARGTAVRADAALPTDDQADGEPRDARPLLMDPVQFLTTMLVLKTFALVVLSVAAARLLPDTLGAWEYLGLGALLALALLLGNAAARGWIVTRATGLSAQLMRPVRMLMQIATPFTLVLHVIGKRNRADAEITIPDDLLLSENGLRLLMGMGGDENPIHANEKEMIASILEMDDTAAREVMVPRMDMVTLPANAGMLEALDVILEAGHSRIPVYDNNVDQIVGILYAKDFLRYYRENRVDTSIRNLVRPAHFVPLSKKVNVLLRDMQKHRVHIAMVVDEYGGIAGLLTIEDILEEIVGDIQDEYDRDEDLYVEMVGNDAYLLNSRLDLYSVAKLLDVELSDEDADTLGGLIYSVLGHVPAPDETVDMADWQFTVLSVDGNRIDQVRAERKPTLLTPEAEDEGGDIASAAHADTAPQADAETTPGDGTGALTTSAAKAAANNSANDVTDSAPDSSAGESEVDAGANGRLHRETSAHTGQTAGAGNGSDALSAQGEPREPEHAAREVSANGTYSVTAQNSRRQGDR